MKKHAAIRVSALIMAVTLSSLSPMGSYQIVAEAHSGRTDANGGHRDNKNKSGLGNYHYHCGGNPPHLHSGGVCPYANAAPEVQTSKTELASNRDSTNNSENTNYADNIYQPPAPQLGWQKNDIGWYYSVDNDTRCRNGLTNINNQNYFFDTEGYMVTDWLQINDKWSYFNSDGCMVYGWQSINNLWYYFDENGHMLTGFQTIGDDAYYFFEDGHMAVGLVYMNGQAYYFDSDGSMDSDRDDDDRNTAYDDNDLDDDELEDDDLNDDADDDD